MLNRWTRWRLWVVCLIVCFFSWSKGINKVWRQKTSEWTVVSLECYVVSVSPLLSPFPDTLQPSEFRLCAWWNVVSWPVNLPHPPEIRVLICFNSLIRPALPGRVPYRGVRLTGHNCYLPFFLEVSKWTLVANPPLTVKVGRLRPWSVQTPRFWPLLHQWHCKCFLWCVCRMGISGGNIS